MIKRKPVFCKGCVFLLLNPYLPTPMCIATSKPVQGVLRKVIDIKGTKIALERNAYNSCKLRKSIFSLTNLIKAIRMKSYILAFLVRKDWKDEFSNAISCSKENETVHFFRNKRKNQAIEEKIEQFERDREERKTEQIEQSVEESNRVEEDPIDIIDDEEEGSEDSSSEYSGRVVAETTKAEGTS